MPGDVVCQAAGVFNIEKRHNHFGRDILAGVGNLLKLPHDRAHQRFGFQRGNFWGGQTLNLNLEVRLGLRPFGNAHPFFAFQHDPHGAVRNLEYLDDLGSNADFMQIFRIRVFGGDLLLGHQQDMLAAGHRFVECLDRFLAPDKQRKNDAGKVDVVADRQQGQFIWKRRRRRRLCRRPLSRGFLCAGRSGRGSGHKKKSIPLSENKPRKARV